MKIGVSSFPEPPECVWSGARESKSLGKHLAEDSTCDVTCKGAHSLLKNGIFSLICSFSESKPSRPNEKVYVSGPPSQDVPEIQCQFKFTLYVKGQVDEETTKGQTGVDMEGIKGGVKGQVEPERRSLLEDFSDREDRHQQRDKH